MRNLVFLVSVLLLFSCSKKNNLEQICIKSLSYESRKYELIPDLIRINIEDKNHQLVKRLSMYKEVDKVTFYSLPLSDREYFLGGSIITSKDSITIQATTSFFNSERGRKKWTSKEVENLLLKDSIGLIFNKDTLIVKRCK